MTTASSWAYVYDMSPPVAGHVYDGHPGTLPSHVKDIDYQTDMSSLSVYWEGFYDAHTVIKHYSVQVGTCSGCTDVMKQQYIGIHKGTNLIINRDSNFWGGGACPQTPYQCAWLVRLAKRTSPFFLIAQVLLSEI